MEGAKIMVRRLAPKQEYGTVMVVIGFLNYIYPVAEK